MTKIITISRQLGSKGWEIGHTLARELGISFYNEELIELSAKKSGMSPEVFAKYDERSASSLLYSLSLGAMPGEMLPQNLSMSFNDTVFASQAETIKELAEKGPCVIVGRCADYILRDRKDVLNIFIYADTDARIANIVERDGIFEKEALSDIKKSDKTRAAYHNFYSDRKWGKPECYHAMFNSSLGVDAIVKTIMMLYKA